jgi:hypothetical protein
MKRLLCATLVGSALGAALPAAAVPISWTDWTSQSATIAQVLGTLSVGSSTVNVTHTGAYSLAITGVGTNYWSPTAPYLSATVDNAPPASDIIQLNTGGTVTISFSETVHDPLIGLVSWNGNTVDFGTTIEILSFGAGFWGSGTPILNATGTGFVGSGEVHGVIRLPGDFDSITFTHTTENWHGYTVGVVGLADATAVPEPASLVLLGIGLAGLASVRRLRKA